MPTLPPHPLLNLELSQQLVVEPIINMDNISLEPHWDTLLLEMFQVTCGWDAQTLVDNTEHFIRHIGSDSTFAYKQDLIDSLKIIYARLSHQLSHDFPPLIDIARANIILPVAEGIPFCTIGLYNRIIITVTHLKSPQTIAALLMRARIALVTTATRTESSDIHVNTRAMTIANAMGFGVPLINAEDPHAQDELINKRLGDILQKAIMDFRPFHIINALLSEIKKVMALNGYEGERRALDSMQTGYGYTTTQYQPFVDYLRLILTDNSNTPLMILDEKDEVIDLDWFQISFMIWKRLIELFYLQHPIEWMEPFYISDRLFDAEPLLTLFPSLVDFFQFLQLFPQLSPEKTTALSLCYIDGYFAKIPQDRGDLMAMFLKTIGHLYGLSSDPQPTIDVVFQVIKENYVNDCAFFLLSLDDSKMKLLDDSPDLVKVFVEMLPYLPQDQKQSILDQSYIGLATAIFSTRSSERVLELLNIVTQLDPLQQMSIFSIKAMNGNNLLMLAIEADRVAEARRMIEILMELERYNVDKSLGDPFFYSILSNINNMDSSLMILAANSCLEQHEENDVLLVEDNPVLRQLVEQLTCFTPAQNMSIFAHQEPRYQRNLLMMTLTDSVLCTRLPTRYYRRL